MPRLVSTIALFFSLFTINAQANITFDEVFDGYDAPVEISSPQDGSNRLFIVEKGGRIYIIENGAKVGTPFLDFSTKVSTNSERGLLGLAFHPDFSSNKYFYINYTNSSGNTVISRLKVGNVPNLADPLSEKVMMTINQPYANHNAGDLAFSPVDGYLYIPLGDGGSGGDPECRAQDSTTMIGKVLRIDVDQNIISSPYYGIPNDNPYLDKNNVDDEVWAFGLRNPWRFSFDRENGDMWIADVGQSGFEEVNYISAGTPGGMNFGWKPKEGNACFGTNSCLSSIPDCTSNIYTDPVFAYAHPSQNGGSITGGFVYRGSDFPGLVGYYIFADFILNEGYYGCPNGVFTKITTTPAGITSFGESEDGELYAASLDGKIWRVEDSAPENILLTSSDFPLDGTYEASDTLTISDPTNINADVMLKARNIKFSADVQLANNKALTVEKAGCSQ